MEMKWMDGVRWLRPALEGIQVEGGVQEPLQLHEMRLLVPCGRGSCRFSAGIPEKKETCGNQLQKNVAWVDSTKTYSGHPKLKTISTKFEI